MPTSRRRAPRPDPRVRRHRHRLLAVPVLAISVLAALFVPAVTAGAVDDSPVRDLPEAATDAVEEPWQFRVLGTLPREGSDSAGLSATPHAINASNVTVGDGTVGRSGVYRAAVGDESGPLRVLLDGVNAMATGINDSGEIVADVQVVGATFRGVLIREGLPISVSGIDGGAVSLTDINESSVIVGATFDAAVPHTYLRPAMWRDAEHPELLPMQQNWGRGWASAVNETGTIVGTAINSSNRYAALMWVDGELRSIPGMEQAEDVNDSNTVVGASSIQRFGVWETIPVISRDGRTATRLPVTDRFPNGYAHAINERGDVVGELYDVRSSSGSSVGVVWPAEGGVEIIQDHTDGRVVETARDINDQGWIAATSSTGASSDVEVTLVRMAPPAARLVSAELQRPDQPSGEWRLAPPTGVHEGTPARFVAEVDNPSDDPHVVTVEIVDRDSGDRVQDLAAFESIPSGRSARVELAWDTDGLAWDDAGRPNAPRRYDLVVSADGDEVDRQPFDIVVLPRPMVLVHGFNADATTWERYPGIVRTHHPLWQTFAVGDGQAPGRMNTGSLTNPTAMPNTIYENAEILSGYIDAVRDRTDAAHVDIVAHSMGGLISRQYVQSFMPDPVEGDPVVDHLVMLGTPNHGSPCASILPLAGMYELRPEAAERMNRSVTNRRGVDMSVLAGVPVPFTCQEPSQGDGVVSIASATTGWEDTQVSPNIHTELTGHLDFGMFVLPRLVPGTAGSNAADPNAADPATAAGRLAASRATDAVELPQLATTQVVRIGGREELSIPIPTGDATRIGVAISGGPRVYLDLFAPNGSGEGIPEEQMANPIRSITSRDDEFVPGTWSAYLWNDSTEPTDVTLSIWVEGSSTVLDGTATQRSDGSLDLRATFDDADGAIDTATVTATLLGTDGSRREVALQADDSGVHRARSAEVPEGAYVVQFTASAAADTDAAVERTVLTSVVVGDEPEPEPEPDATAPQVMIDVPDAPGSGWFGEPVTVRIDAADVGEPASGVARIEWQTAGASNATGSAGAEGTQVTVDTDGTTTVTATAVDHAGNRSEPSSVEVRLDRGRPTATIASPTQGARVARNGRLVASYGCDDSASGVASCSATVGSTAVVDGAALPTGTVGTHQLTVTAVDRAGNTATSSVSYTVTASTTVTELFDRLTAEVRAAKLGWLREPPLLAAISAARNTHAAPWTPLSCLSLGVFSLLVEINAAFGWMSATHAATVRGTVTELRTMLRC